jgi:hypothetical protein
VRPEKSGAELWPNLPKSPVPDSPEEPVALNKSIVWRKERNYELHESGHPHKGTIWPEEDYLPSITSKSLTGPFGSFFYTKNGLIFCTICILIVYIPFCIRVMKSEKAIMLVSIRKFYKGPNFFASGQIFWLI